jgi:hypothetical protein
MLGVLGVVIFMERKKGKVGVWELFGGNPFCIGKMP